MAGCLIGIGDVQLNLGHVDTALYFFKKAINIEENMGDKRGSARLRIGACLSRSLFDDIESQLNYYNESLAIAREIEDSTTIAKTLVEMGNINKNNGKFDIAEKNYNQALKIYESFDDTYHIILVIRNLGFIYSDKGNPKKELYYYKKALEIAEKADIHKWIFKMNLRLYYLLEDKSYLETAYNQIQEKIEAMEDELKDKFLTYPIPKQIIEEYNKVFN